MIVRLDRATREHFVILDTRACRDPRLSLKAKGLHTYLMSMSDAWQIRMDDLQTRLLEGREAIQGAFKELRRHGYATLVPIAGENGLKGGSEWVIYETSRKPEEPEAGITGSRETRSPEKPAPFKEDQKKERSNRKEEHTPPGPLKGEECELGLDLGEESAKPKASPQDLQAEQLYQAYPRRVNKKPAMKAITAALRKAPFDLLLTRVQKFALTCAGTEAQYIAHPTTWFNQERWTNPDEPTNRPTTLQHAHDYSNAAWLKNGKSPSPL